MHPLKITLATIMLAGIAGVATGRSVSDFLADAPLSVFPTLTNTDRLDLIDYFSYASTPGSVEDNFGTRWHITHMNENVVTLSTADSTTIQLAIIPAAKDTIVAVISTIATPARDSHLQLYHRDWSPYTRQTPVPRYTDWFTTGAFEALPNLELTLPFVTAEAEVNSEATSITFINTAAQYLYGAEYEKIRPYLIPSITFDIINGKFKVRKQ